MLTDETQKLTKELINDLEDTEYMSLSEAKKAKKNLKRICKEQPKESKLPSINLEDFLIVGRRDREAFIDPYNRATKKAMELFKENQLPYTPLNFEILAMSIMIEE